MSGTFVVVFLIALVLVVFWRATLMIALALVVTFLVLGVGGAGAAVERATPADTPAQVSDPGPDKRAQVPPR